MGASSPCEPIDPGRHIWPEGQDGLLGGWVPPRALGGGGAGAVTGPVRLGWERRQSAGGVGGPPSNQWSPEVVVGVVFQRGREGLEGIDQTTPAFFSLA